MTSQAPRAEDTPAPAAPSITVVAAMPREIVARVVVTGTLTPRETVLVGADVDGLRVESLLADEGDRVEVGQTLARLSTDIVEVSLAQARSRVARADAAITQAKAQVEEAQSAATESDASLKRARSLAEKGIVGQDVLDTRISAASAAVARLAAARQGVLLAEADRITAEAERRELELRRSKAEIKAPTDGLVLIRDVRLGQVVSSAGGALFELARNGEIELNAAVSETVLGRLAVGQPARIDLGSGHEMDGTVRLVSPRVDPATRLGSVKIALAPSPLLRSGAFAKATVETARATGIVVPRTAIVTSGADSTVQVVRDGVIETRKVSLGLDDGDEVQVTQGLSRGDEVVATAGAFVRAGDRVNPVVSDPTRTAEGGR